MVRAWVDQRLDLETSLRSYTVNNTWGEGEEANNGSSKLGKLGDLVIVDRGLFRMPPAHLKDAKVLLTMVAERVTYASAPFTR